MSDAVEIMTRREGTEVSWHGKENTTDTNAETFNLEVWAKDSGLDSNVSKRNLFIRNEVVSEDGEEVTETFEPVKDQVALVRDKDNRVLGYASPGYEIVQPRDILEFLNHYIDVDPRFQWETAGSLNGGRKIFATALFTEQFDVLGEAHKPYLLASTSFDGSLATTIGSTLTRVVCQNTLRMALNSKETAQLRFKHRQEWSASHVERVRAQLQTITMGFDHYKKLAEALAQVKIGKDAAQKFLSELIFTPQLEKMELPTGGFVEAYSKPKTRAKNIIDTLQNCLDVTLAEGTENNSAWATFNAITRYADHEMGSRMTKDRQAEGDSRDSIRLESSLYGAGDSFKQTGLRKLLDYCEVDVKELLAA